MKIMFNRCAKMLRQWSLLHREDDAKRLVEVAMLLEERGDRPPRIT
jgi:hypothetical protein